MPQTARPLSRRARCGAAWQAAALPVLGAALVTGCTGPGAGGTRLDRARLKLEALECLKAAVSYEHNPAVRVGAVEAFEVSGLEEAGPWIRVALLDESPAVRFAGATAVGKLRDASAEEAVRGLLSDEDASVRVAALFALHRLGDTSRSGRMPGYLLDHDDVTVRRNAAMLFGLLEEPGAIKILARAMRDPDVGVRNLALEGMARLGNPEAKQELAFMTNTGIGSEEVFAINALAATGDPIYRDTFLYKLDTAPHLETKLAAARGLGIHGSDNGCRLALRALHTSRATVNDPNDPTADQILRARILAAAALGKIGRVDTLGALKTMLDETDDPRLQVAAARAILEILASNRNTTLPFGEAPKGPRR